MSDFLFSMTASICARFPAMSPFDVYRERFCDVIQLFVDMIAEHSTEKLRKANGGTKPPEGSFVRGNTLYIPAQNDDWF
jgi:hypothetical protein